MRKILMPALLLAFVVIFYWIGLSETSRPVQLTSGLKVGDSLPDFAGTDVKGQPIALSDFSGKVILLNFFGDW